MNFVKQVYFYVVGYWAIRIVMVGYGIMWSVVSQELKIQ